MKQPTRGQSSVIPPGRENNCADASAVLPESQSPRAARILAAAAELLLSRGFKGLTISDVAQRAYVGKGTVYGYWATKEDLLIGLIGREFLATSDELITTLIAHPDTAHPSRFCSAMIRTTRSRALMSALHDHDDDVLGLLTTHPRAAAVEAAIGPRAVLRAALPTWRRNGMARTDWDLDEQAVALLALNGGIMLSLAHPGLIDGADPMKVLGPAVTALLGSAEVGDDQMRDAASDLIAVFRHGRETVLHIISSPDYTEATHS